MSDNTEDVEKALEAYRGGGKKTRFYLRRFLGKETKFEEENGHIFHPDSEERDGLGSWCQDGTCELSDRDRAEQHDCPTNLEGIPQDVSDWGENDE